MNAIFKILLFFILYFSFFPIYANVDPDCELVKYDRNSWGYDSKHARKRLLKEELLRQEKVGYLDTGKVMDAYTGTFSNLYKKDINGDMLLGSGGVKISNMDVDHVVPLKYAHLHGGCKWSIDKKKEFANNPINLKMTSIYINRSKGDKGPEDFFPEGDVNRLKYMQMWQKVAKKYPAIPEHDVIYAANVLRALNRQNPKLFIRATKVISLTGRVVLVIGALDITYTVGSAAYDYYLNHYSDDDALNFSIKYSDVNEQLSTQPY